MSHPPKARNPVEGSVREARYEQLGNSVHSEATPMSAKAITPQSNCCRGLKNHQFYGPTLKVTKYTFESQWLIIMGYFKPRMVYFGV